MSKYDADATKVILERLDDLTKKYKRIEDEITKLDNYRKSMETIIMESMDEIKKKEFNGLSIQEETIRLIDFEGLFNDYPNIIPYLVGNVDEGQTLTIMVNNQIDFGVSKKWLDTALSKNTVKTIEKRKLRVWYN